MTEEKKPEIDVDNCTIEELRTLVKDLLNNQKKFIQVLDHNAGEFNKVIADVNKGFKQRDKMLQGLTNTQAVILREINPIIGDYKKAQAHMLHQMFSANDRGPKMDN